jgi:hypothetical protein
MIRNIGCDEFPYALDFLGDRDWDMKLKPMVGFPLYCGWIDALNIAIERMKNPPGILIEL